MATKTVEQKNIPTAAEVLAAKKQLEDMTESLKVSAMLVINEALASLEAAGFHYTLVEANGAKKARKSPVCSICGDKKHRAPHCPHRSIEGDRPAQQK